jgi:DNA-binding MarR family transcriptional regulator
MGDEGGKRRVNDTISFRWGIPELDHGNVLIPEPILLHHTELGVTGNLFVLVVHLAAFRYESARGVSCPSYQTLAKRLGLTRRRVMGLVEQLEDAGLLIVTRNNVYHSNEFSLEPFARACWDKYKASSSETGFTGEGNFTSEKNGTGVVKLASPEEQEEKKNKKSSSATPRPKMPGEVLTRLTETYADLKGIRPQGEEWLPIQQGFRLAWRDGNTEEQILGCMNRIVSLGWPWTINTVRKWLPDFRANGMANAVMPKEPEKVDLQRATGHDPAIYEQRMRRREEEQRRVRVEAAARDPAGNEEPVGSGVGPSEEVPF